MAPAPEPRFIVLEGIDGCGSTTAARRLVDALVARGEDARLTCEPSGGPIGKLIRQALRRELPRTDAGAPREPSWGTMSLLFAADRLDHVDSVIFPALAAGATVVSDRYDLSSLAYQSATSPGGAASVPWIRELNRRARRPALTIVIDVSAEVAAQRRSQRGGREELFEASDVQRRLAAIYARAEDLVPGDRVVHISGEGSVEETSELVLRAVLDARS
jgi:dTMP kinase